MLEQLQTEPQMSSQEGLKPKKEKPTREYKRCLKDHKQILAKFREHRVLTALLGQMRSYDEEGGKFLNGDRWDLWDFCEDNDMDFYEPLNSVPDPNTLEMARAIDQTAAMVCTNDLISYGEESIGTISVMEAIFDAWLDKKPHLSTRRTLYLPDCKDPADFKFSPPGIKLDSQGNVDLMASNPRAVETHFHEAIRSANFLRKEFFTYLKQAKMFDETEQEHHNVFEGLLIAKSKEQFDQNTMTPNTSGYEISDHNLHIEDLVQAFNDIFTGKKVILYFSSDTLENGSHVIRNVSNTDAEKVRILTQYVKEGTAIRKLLLKRFTNNPHTRIVHTIEDAKASLRSFYEELQFESDKLNPAPNWMAQ